MICRRNLCNTVGTELYSEVADGTVTAKISSLELNAQFVLCSEGSVSHKLMSFYKLLYS